MLKRIGGGDDLSGPDGVSFRISARGLESRRLVTVSRSGPPMTDWAAAEEIRAFCDALEQAAVNDNGSAASANRTDWISWARAAADRLDPIAGEAALGIAPFDIEPSSDDLRPYIGDWSPHRPSREYRSERGQERIAEDLRHVDTWHHGMRGRPPWRRKR